MYLLIKPRELTRIKELSYNAYIIKIGKYGVFYVGILTPFVV